uniref:Tyrosine-protein kinase ephrin type A/B receptor-like domain-containing protein n=1 Tax=Biomphalaria glabrata TaxID=6526 RepID=A0A2C9KIF5_BIOGL
MKCPSNTSTSSQASTSINDCNVAYCEPVIFSNDNISCIACPIGTYKNETGNHQNQCLPCPLGVTTPDVGNTNIANCARVSCNAGYYRVNETHCNPCVKGEYQDERDQAQCKICPQIDGRPSSTFNIASTNWTDCYPLCEAGYFTSTNRSCSKCPYGRYKNITDLSTSCQACPFNFTTVITGATSLLDCKFSICKKGFYRPTSLYIDCVKCPIGTYKNMSTVEMTNCELCPTNQTTLIEGATYQSRYCISNCPGGQGYSWTSQNCTLCPVGQYKEEAALINVCKYCPTNSTTLKPGSTSCIQSNVHLYQTIMAPRETLKVLF